MQDFSKNLRKSVQRTSFRQSLFSEERKIEDSILKLASEVFARELLPYFGIKEKVVATVPTELIRLELILIPLMGGSLTKQEKIIRAINVAKDIEQKETRQLQAMLYAFAERFLTAGERVPIKEGMLMTDIGQMIMDEGIGGMHAGID